MKLMEIAILIAILAYTESLKKEARKSRSNDVKSKVKADSHYKRKCNEKSFDNSRHWPDFNRRDYSYSRGYSDSSNRRFSDELKYSRPDRTKKNIKRMHYTNEFDDLMVFYPQDDFSHAIYDRMYMDFEVDDYSHPTRRHV